MRKRRSLLIGLVLLLLVSTIFTTPAMAASNPPYVYTFTDTAATTHYRYYKYDSATCMFALNREFYSIGNTLYTSAGYTVSSDMYGSGIKYNVYDQNGNFFFITKNGETRRMMQGTTDQEVVLTSGSQYFVVNTDDIGVSVMTSAGKKLLSSLTPGTPGPDKPTNPEPVTPTPAKNKNRVVVNVRYGGEVYNIAYKNNQTKLTVVVSGDESSVMNLTHGVILTDTLKGAKFCGIDTKYNVYLYELPGTLYKFTYGKWYSASKISLKGTFKTYKVDSNGFVNAFVTTKGTFKLKDLDSGNKWIPKKTYAVTKSNYATLYVKGKSTSYTLKLKSGTLILGDKKVASGVSKFGFVSAKKLCYIKGGKCYTAPISNPTKATLFAKSVKSLKRSSKNGLVNKIVLKGGKTKKIS